MLNVARLRVLRELHLRGTLAAVADALSYTPSAVSQQLSQLEKEAGVQLLEKVGRGVRLTDQAITLVGHTEAILARLELAESELAAAQPEVRGVLRVASFQSVVLELAPAALTPPRRAASTAAGRDHATRRSSRQQRTPRARVRRRPRRGVPGWTP